MISSRAMLATCMAFLFVAVEGRCASSPPDAAQKGRTFLVNLVDPDLGLLPEYHGAKVYWLFHDNYLAAKVLAVGHPRTAQRIMDAIHREGIWKSGKIELLFGEVEKPLPFRLPQLVDVRQVGDKIIRTEAVTDRVFDGWEKYADLQLLACIATGRQSTARQHWDAAMGMWDGNGFLDAAARHDHRYSTYKLGLALLAANHLSPPTKLPAGLLDKLLALQDESGGWITDYDTTGQKIGLANVETTCLVILGIESLNGHKQPPSK